MPITDLAVWHDQNPEYAHYVAACRGGILGTSVEVDRERSPICQIKALSEVTFLLHHRRFDPVVPYSHIWNLARELVRYGAKRFFADIFDGEHHLAYHTAFR